jgi:hypothetical protein
MSNGSATRSDREFLRHTLATLAYRAEKALRDVPPEFAVFRVSPESRTPLEILGHMGDLMEWGARMAEGDRTWAPGPSEDWPRAHARFFEGLAALDRALVEAEYDPARVEHVFQGPIADALTHVGQIALLRGLAGAAVRPENYMRATIEIGRVGTDQATDRSEFDGDGSRPQPPR